jgi:hypothetical protein
MSALTARNRMIGKLTKQAHPPHSSLQYRTDDLSGDYLSMIESEVIKVNPSLAGAQSRVIANRISLMMERIISEMQNPTN